MGNFALSITSVTLSESNGVITVHGHLEGPVDGFGLVMGTASFEPAGASSGTYETVAVSFPSEGEQATATGSGEWTKIDADTWTTTGLVNISTGDVVKADGEIKLSTRSWNGTLG